MNRLKCFIAALTAVILLPGAVFADGNSLTINSENYRASYAIYKVADSGLNETADFAALDMDYASIETAEDMDNASDSVLDYIGTHGIEPLRSLSGDNSITFTDLESGLYFLEFVSYDEETVMSSFLIMLPYYDSVSGTYLADAAVNAKVYIDGGDPGGDDPGNSGPEDPPEEIHPIPPGGGGGGEDDIPPGGGGYTPSGGGDSSDMAGIRIYTTPEHSASDEAPRDTDIILQPDPEEEEIILPYPEESTEPPTQAETTTVTEQTTTSSASGGTLPQTGGDKTVLMCYYVGGVTLFIGAVVLFVNNKKLRKDIN